jgi:hypothetical protein
LELHGATAACTRAIPDVRGASTLVQVAAMLVHAAIEEIPLATDGVHAATALVPIA